MTTGTSGSSAQALGIDNVAIQGNAAPPTPTITFGTAPTPTYLGGNFTVTSTNTNTDNPATTYSRVSGPCALVSGATFSSSGAGTCVVKADTPATTNFTAATAQQSITIAKAPVTATFSINNSFVGYTGQPQSPVVSYSNATTDGNVVNVLAGGQSAQTNRGEYTVTGNFVPTDSTNYQTLPNVTFGTFTIGKGTQSLTFTSTAPSNAVVGDTYLAAATSSAGLTVSFQSLTSTTCTTGGTNGSTISFISAGNCWIQAIQTGDDNYNAADPVDQTFNISAATCHTLTAGSQATYPAAAITVPVSVDAITAEEGILSADLYLNYDTAVLSAVHTTGNVVAATRGTVISDGSITVSEDAANPGSVHISIYDATGFLGAGTLVNISFNVVGGAGTQSAMTIPDGAKFGNASVGDLCATEVGGTVTVAAGSTTTEVTSSGSSTYGGPVTFTATMTAIPPVPAVSGGTVSFYDGGDCTTPGASLGSPVSLTGNTAQLTTSALAAGTHTIVGCYSGSANFTASGGSVSQSVAQKSVAAAVAAPNKTYDGGTASAISSCTIPGKVGSDDVACTVTSASFADKNVANGKTVTATGIALTGATAGNYVLSSTSATTTANITKRDLTVTASADNKAYDGLTTATVQLDSNKLSGDALTLSNTTASFDNKNVGTGKTVTVNGISIGGTDAVNYNLLNTSATASANITARALSVTAAGVNKVYDGLVNATVTLSDNRLSGDVFTASYTGAAFDSKNVGSAKPVSVTGISISGTDAGNYSANSTTGTTANITARDLTVSAAGVNKVYDGTTTATANLTSDKVAADALTLAYTTATFASKTVGTGINVGVTGISIGGADAGNYNLLNTTASTTANITARTLTVTATGVDKPYDGNNAATVTLSDNRVSGDVFTDSYVGATFNNKNAGTSKPVSVTGISITGTDAGNYALASTNAATTASISAKTLTVSAAGVNKVYDGTVAATVNLSDNRIAGDVFTDSYSGATFDTKTVGTAKPVGVTGISITGTDAGNYTLALTTASTAADITARGLTITAAGVNKVYDGTSAATVTLSDDRVSGDTFTRSATATFGDPNVGAGKPVSVTGIAISGGDSGNYSLANTTASTSADITRAAAVCTVTTYNVAYDGNSHTATGSCKGVQNENLSGLDLSHTVHTDPGNYTDDYWFFTSPNGNYSDIANTTITDSITTGTLTGTVTNVLAGNQPVAGVTVTATGTPTRTGNTIANGTYSITGFGAGSYSFAAAKTKQACNVANGITSDDAALVSQYVVQLASLSATQQIAAHVSSVTSAISSLDAALIAQKAVFNCHPNNRAGEWIFGASSLSPTIMGTDKAANFTGFMMGDVDGTWATAGSNRPSEEDTTPGPNAVVASVPSLTADTGTQVTVPLRIDNLAGRSVRSTQFTIDYDPNVIDAVAGAASVQATNAETLGVVSNVPTPGKLMVAVYGAIPVSGDGVYVNLTFNVMGAAGSSTPIAISGFRFNADTDEVGAVNGQLTVNAANTEVTLSGKVVNAEGRAIGRASVTATSSTGASFSTTTSRSGRFSMNGLLLGETYTVVVQSRRYTFTPQSVTINQNATELQIIAEATR